MDQKQAYPSIDMCIRELLLSRGDYNHFVKYLSRYPNNTWMYMEEKELQFIYDIIYCINNKIRLFFVLDKTSYNYKFSNDRNIYHIICEYELIEDINHLSEFCRIINKYFTEDINKIDGSIKTPLEYLLCEKNNKNYIIVLYDHGAIITENIIMLSKSISEKYQNDIYDFLLELSYPDVKCPDCD
jgi:hypothetical protein